MNDEMSPHAIAARIRGIIGGQDHGLVEAVAERLGVSEVSLRMSIDELGPHPTVDVLIALVRTYGVDPTWLVTGDYDAATHRAAVDEEASGSKRRIGELIAQRLTPGASRAAIDRAHLRLEA